VFLCIGVLYMFLALAIVCDEFFVPALEEMSSKRRMNLSMDVAGATLMAAGGSAPELFTSLFGTFTESEIGFGTIVGSAVFNVLFVIAMCTIFSKEVLALTWWPLFRDSLFYAIGLVVLSIFVGVTSPEEIELWEAIVLFAMYFLYCVIMYFNADIYHYLTGKVLIYPEDSDDEESTASQEQRQEAAAATRDIERPSLEKEGSANSLASALHLVTLQNDLQLMGQHSFRWQGTFRAGILKLLRDPHTWVETGGVGIVAKIAGDADYIFRKIDANGDGHLDKEELKRLFEALDCHVSPEELTEVFDILDVNKDGVISEEEFNKWYTTSAELIRILSWTQYIIVFPLVFAMVFTIPDVRRPGWGRWCYLSFVLSIAWIGGFAYLMVTWAETIGNTVGIPSVIMGLTVLAAGTSVPDLLSSVIVARRGSGDMAVSSSIGSNIFDILVGLPVPWILYTSWPSKDSTVVIASGKIWISIFVLIGMLVFVIAAVHCQGWKLTKTLGAMMIVFYFAFLAQAILLE
ncbi:2-phosphoglycolate phosphatase, partial [Phaeodactylum tricornutum CCAP 1055/1]